MTEKIWIDYEKLPTAALENRDCLEPDRAFLSIDEILHICKILDQRRRSENTGEEIDIKKRWEDYLTAYLDEEI